MEKKILLKQNRRPTKAGWLASILIIDSNVLHNRINEKIIKNINLWEGPIFIEKKNLLKQSKRPTKAGWLASILIIDLNVLHNRINEKILITDSNVLHNKINEKIIININLLGGPILSSN